MSDKVGLRDKRDSKWFWIDNAVYDLKLSCEAMALYCAIARYANNQTEKAYFSGKKFKAHHKIGHGKLEAARAELLKHNLIAETGNKTLVGALYYELREVSQGRTVGCSEAEQGGVSPQNTNHTNKTIQENHTDLPMHPNWKEPKENTKKQISTESIQLSKPIYDILKESVYKVERSKTLTEKIAKAVKELGGDVVTRGTLARIEYMRKAGKDLYFHSFIADFEAIEWQASQYKDPSTPTQSNMSAEDEAEFMSIMSQVPA
jgi:uncharacterized membrane-anchored protein YjiN (DUF445 family)